MQLSPKDGFFSDIILQQHKSKSFSPLISVEKKTKAMFTAYIIFLLPIYINIFNGNGIRFFWN